MREIRGERGEVGRKPVLLTHYYVRKYLSGGTMLLSDNDVAVMNPSGMKPGFNMARLEAESKILQGNLTKLVSDKYQSKLSPKVHLKIALVDLTEHKSHTPIIAGHGERDSMYAASLPKILALYAAYQLRFDLNTLARLNGIKKISELKKSILKEWSKVGLVSRLAPKLDLLFQFKENPVSTVQAELWWKTPGYIRKDKSAKYLIVTPDIQHDKTFPRYLILALGFDYIGSVALKSGLFDEKLGGLWLNANYYKPWRPWSKSPFPTAKSHNATALAAASFFTLLDQGRLVNQITSNEIAEDLKKKKCFEGGGMLDGIKTLPGAPNMISPNIPPNKCGRVRPYFSEAIHMVRRPAAGKHPRYVAAVLTKQDPFTISFPELGRDLDALIAAQNP